LTLFSQKPSQKPVAKFSGLEQMVVPGGVFHDVIGDISVFAPSDDALLEEIAYFGEVFNLTPEEVKEDKPVLQEILRQFIAYGDVTKVKGFRGLFVRIAFPKSRHTVLSLSW
jgi:hypothetical protein